MDSKEFVILVQRHLITAHENIAYYGRFPATAERERRIAYHEGARDALKGILEQLKEAEDGSETN